MADVNGKVTFIFRMGAKAWTLSIFRTAADLLTVYNASAGLAQGLANMLGLPGFIDGYRVTDAAAQRAGLQTPIGTTYSPQNSDGAAQYSSDAIRWQLRDASGLYKRQFWLRGVPDSWLVRSVLNPDRFATGGTYAFYRDQLIALLSNQGWQIKARSHDPAVTGRVRITDVAPGGNPGETVITAPGHTIADGSKFQIRGGKRQGTGWTRMRGTFRAIDVTGDDITINYPAGVPAVYQGGATAENIVVVFVPVASAGEVGLGTRRTKKAFFQGRGQ